MYYKNLTDRQKKVLDTIVTQVNTFGNSPTIREIQKASGIKSTRGVILQLEALQEAGYITRNRGARGIYLNPALLGTSSNKTVSVPFAEEEETISIPLMTSPIPAGYASMVDEFSDSKIHVSIQDTKGITNEFAVTVTGDSMIGAGIDDGDIVAALIPDRGVTLKKFKIVDGWPILVPANPKYSPIVNNFVVQGKLINLLKGQ